MSSKTKILWALVAAVSFAVGALLNTTRVDRSYDIQPLLHARLATELDTASIKDALQPLTLVNFWASWCRPCRKEMPVFEALFRSHSARGFNVIGVAIDSPEKTRTMLDSMDITYPILYAEQTGMQLMETAGNPDGFLPYSLLLDQQGKVLDRVLGQIHEQQIIDWIEKYL